MNQIHISTQEQLYNTIRNQILLITVANLSTDIVEDLTQSATEFVNSGDNANDPEIVEAIRYVTEILANNLLNDLSKKEQQS